MDITRIITSNSAYGDQMCGGGKCPTLHLTSDKRIVIQGYKLTKDEVKKLNVPSEEDAIVMDLTTFSNLIKQL